MGSEKPEQLSAQGAIALTAANLPLLRQDIARPTYDRRQLRPAIAHIGVGGFHRAHQAVYLDDLAQRGISLDWGLTGIGVLPQDKRMAEALLPQQCLYTVVVRGADTETARVVGSITGYLFAPEQREAVIKTLADPATRIVSLTVTEGGYNFNESTGAFNAENPAIQRDLAHPDAPTTFFAYICEALDRRRKAGAAPFTVLSCDNVQGNGAVAKKMISAFATLRDPGLARWIEEHVAFPNSMVDRITPQTTDQDRQLVADHFGIVDAWPVMTEPFRQWVIEDTFSLGRPPLDEVGAQFVTDVHPYETMKMRLLNASHQALSFLGYLCGYRLVHEVMDDPLFQRYIGRMMDEEITPLLPPVPGIDLNAYKRSLLERFSNPNIRDQLSRICFDATARMPKFVLPSINEALAAQRPYTLLSLAVAAWFRYLWGEDEQGAPITVEDRLATELQALARQGKDDPRPLLSLHEVFGDLGQQPSFVQTLQDALRRLYRDGAHATLAYYLAS